MGVNATERTNPCAIPITFRAPIDTSSDEAASNMISYEEYREADELELLKTGQFKRYAEIQCLKICFYMQKVRNIEIL